MTGLQVWLHPSSRTNSHRDVTCYVSFKPRSWMLGTSSLLESIRGAAAETLQATSLRPTLCVASAAGIHCGESASRHESSALRFQRRRERARRTRGRIPARLPERRRYERHDRAPCWRHSKLPAAAQRECPCVIREIPAILNSSTTER